MRLFDTKREQHGFTIVELMISMAILSVILVVVSVAMISIGNLYKKGINQAKVQTAVRNISSGISDQLRLNSGNSGVGSSNVLGQTAGGQQVKAICIGDNRYTYVVGVQQGADSTESDPRSPHVLWRDKYSGGDCAASAPNISQNNPAGVDGVELIPDNARLTHFEVTETGSGSGVYVVRIGIAYGENDLLTGAGLGTRCISDANTRFCATAYLQTKVAQRM